MAVVFNTHSRSGPVLFLHWPKFKCAADLQNHPVPDHADSIPVTEWRLLFITQINGDLSISHLDFIIESTGASLMIT